MEYFRKDAIRTMVYYCKNKNYRSANDLDEAKTNEMYVEIFDSEPKFKSSNNDCFNYIDNKASTLYEIILTVEDHGYDDTSLNEIFNSYWFWVGRTLENKKEDTFREIFNI